MTSFNTKNGLQDFLEKKVAEYNRHSFIEKDPVSVPHQFSKKQDIEISGLFASVFAWGNRTTIIQKSNELMCAMDEAPYDFIMNHETADLKRLFTFKHRTFNTTDLLYFVRFLKFHYQHSDTLESAFLPGKIYQQTPVHDNGQGIVATLRNKKKRTARESNELTTRKSDELITSENETVKDALSVFYKRFFSLDDAPDRTHKHIASPDKNSTCKRLNMYLRWMVRKDKKGVDFGIWRNISSADLICPVDLHVARVARGFGLISRTQTDWQTAMELTSALRKMDPKDPVKFDFALFSLGASEKY